MGHTNTTTNYALPQFITTDKPGWLTDVNGAFSDIDAAINTAQSDATTAGNNATQALSDASAAATAAATADGKGAGAVASIADIFDPTSTYSINDLVMYNNLLYICTTAVTTPGPWTGVTNWTRTTIESQFPSAAIAALQEAVGIKDISSSITLTTSSATVSGLTLAGAYQTASMVQITFTFDLAVGTDLAVINVGGVKPITNIEYSSITVGNDIIEGTFYASDGNVSIRRATTQAVSRNYEVSLVFIKNPI